MKRLIHILCLGIVLALASCTDFKEPGIELGGVSASPESLSFSSSGDSRNVYVKGGERWDISSKPTWLSVNSIQSSHYSWTVVLSAAANKDYNRSGSLTLKSKSSTATVSVTQSGEKGQYVPVTSVSVRPNSIELTEGDKYQLSAVFSPDNASNKTVSWESSATSVATVSSSGLVTAVAEGTATIKVRTEDGNYTATSTVTVRKRVINVTGVSLNKTSVTLTKGETSQLTATVSPSNATNPSVSWKSSSSSVATVSSSGLVKAAGGGTATITVTTEDGNYTATCKLTVKVPVTGVSLDKTDLSLTEGDTYQLSATVSPSNATNKTVIWKSSSTAVATVSSSGLITAKAEGSATITVTTEDGSKTATCRVTVKKKVISVTGVSLNTTSLTLTEGDTYQLAATVSPSNATNKNVKWQSSAAGIATVSSSGLVTAKLIGSATITVTTEDGSKTATCRVTVNKKTISVTGVSLNYTSITLSQGATYQLTATVSPSNATNKNVGWQSNATGIATVSTSGLVTAITSTGGTAAINVRTEDGGYTATCWVTVRPATGYENGHEWVDLGLPSGLKWATCNVGANSPSDYGDYYAWGETSTKSDYSWSTYKWCNGSDNTLTKYNTNSDYGMVDNKTRLELSDDAARANWGGSWRMPTYEELYELINKDNCTWTWTTQDGKNGYRVTSRTNGNSIFLPAAGYRSGDNLNYAGRDGRYRSSSHDGTLPNQVIGVGFNDLGGGGYGILGPPYLGLSVRPVSE